MAKPSAPAAKSGKDGPPPGMTALAPYAGAVQEDRAPSKDSLTPSMRELMDQGSCLADDRGYKAVVCLHAKRLITTDLSVITLLPGEYKSLVEKMNLGNRAAQYCAWRSSLLWTGTFFFAFLTAIDVVTVMDPWGYKSEDSGLMQKVDPSYRQYFSSMRTCQWVQAVGLMLASVAAVVGAAAAAGMWKKVRISRFGTLGSWLCSYMPPFVLLLVIPFRSSIDFQGVQVQMCNDMLNLTAALNAAGAAAAGNQANSLATAATGGYTNQYWPGKIGDLASTLYETYSVQLPSDFCDGKPTEWGTKIRNLLQQNGYLARDDGSCGFSDSAKLSLSTEINASIANNGGSVSYSAVSVTAGVNAADCPADCMNCTTVCAPHLMRLGSLAAVHGPEVLSRASIGGVAQRCTHCVARSNLYCPIKCVSIGAAMNKQAILGMVPKAARSCLKTEDLAEFELLLQLGTQTSYWKMMLGAVYALLAMSTLLPLAFSLMLGAAKGAGIAKSLVPYSRVPTVVSTAAAVFTFPFVLMIMILVQNVAGTWLTLVGIILILIAFVLSMKPGSLTTAKKEEREKWSNRMSRAGQVTMILAIIIFLIVLATSDLASAGWNLAKDQGLNVTSEDLAALRSQVFWMTVQTVSSILGKSLISTVFFTDAVVTVMHKFHKGEDLDPFSIQCARTKLVDDLDTLYKKDSNAQDPASTGMNDAPVDFGGLIGQHQAMMSAKVQHASGGGQGGDALAKHMKDLEKIQAKAAVRAAARQVGAQSSQAASAARAAR